MQANLSSKSRVSLWILAALTLTGGACAQVERTEARSNVTDADLVLWDAASLRRSRAAIAKGEPRTSRAKEAVLREAQRFLREPIVPITQGKARGEYTAPTGDARDYVSLSPYWWPDPDSPNGLPYKRRDGQINPDRKKYDANKLARVGDALQALSIGYFLTGDARFAKRASEHLTTWFLDPKTRMNPHFRFAQFRPGRSAGSHGGVIESLRIRWLPDNAALLLSSEHWSREQHDSLKRWYASLLDWMLTSKLGKKESKSKNNHGTWYSAQAAKFAFLTGRHDVAKKLVRGLFERIDKQIAEDGSQPHEMKRTRSLGYHDFNLRAYMDAARIGERLGVDLLGFQTEDGRGIRRAIEFSLPRMTGEKPWPGKQIVPPRRHNQFQMFRIAARMFDDERYEKAARKLQPKNDSHAWIDIALPAIH